MKKILVFLAVLALGFLAYKYFFKSKANDSAAKVSTEEQKPIEINKLHTAEFNGQVKSIISSYLAVKDAFVEADTANVKMSAQKLVADLDALNIEELKKSGGAVYQTTKATVADVKSNATSLLNQKDLTEMRRDFSSLTQMLYPTFFQTIGYEGEKLYLQNCPMAFNDTEEASWLSNNAEIMNPYLGKTHPKYKATMLHCGEVKDSIFAK